MNANHSPRSSLARAPERRRQAHQRAIVLIVDDDPFIRELLAMGLSAHGFETVTAKNGQEAIDLCGNCDVALVDSQMPGLSGQETVTAIRRAAPRVRLCVMSGDIGHCLVQDVGTNTLIGKPFMLEDVARTLRRLIEPPLACAQAFTGRAIDG